MAQSVLYRNAGIDALRGASIVLVVMHHIAIRLPLSATLLARVLPGRLLDALNWNGYESVLVFFVISGFLITRNALLRWPALGQPTIRDFYARRFARIFPCLIALVAALSMLDLARVTDYTITQQGQSLAAAIASALGLYLNWYEGQTGYLPGGWDVLWSLSIEEVFYLGFPLACLLARRNTNGFCAALALLSVAVAFRHALYPHNEIWREKAYLPGMAAIATGMLAAILVHGKTLSRNHAKRATGAGLLLYAAILFYEDLIWPYLQDATLLLLTIGTALLLLGANARPAPRTLLTRRAHRCSPAKKESSSFLKKRSKKLLFSVADSLSARALKNKSFLVLFFKKEHSRLLSSATCLSAGLVTHATAWLQVFGGLSYEIYLTHMFVVFATLRLFKAMGGTAGWGFLLYPLCLATAAGLAATVARLVSQPCEITLRRWLLTADPRPSAPATHIPDKSGKSALTQR